MWYVIGTWFIITCVWFTFGIKINIIPAVWFRLGMKIEPNSSQIIMNNDQVHISNNYPGHIGLYTSFQIFLVNV